MATESSPVQSIDRVLDLMEVLSGQPHGMTLTELSNKSGLHTSTVYRLLSALSVRGYVQKDIESGKYRLTMRMFEIGSRVVSGLNLLSVSRPYLEHLASYTSETIHLVARDGDEMVYLYKEDARDSIVRMASFVGLRSPMYCTAVGKSILAYLPDDVVAGIWKRTVVRAYTPNTITQFKDLQKNLDIVRSRGYAVDAEEHEIGVFCIAAPIFDFSGTPVGAISISSPTARLTDEKKDDYAHQCRLSASAVTNILGGPVKAPPCIIE